MRYSGTPRIENFILVDEKFGSLFYEGYMCCGNVLIMN